MKKVFAILLAFVMVFSLCSCGEKSQAEEEPTAYFDFTVSEFTDVFENEYGINLTPIMTIDADDGGKISSYSCNTEIEYNYVHYSVSHDAATNKVSFISFDFDKSKRDMTGNLTLYYIHIGVIAEIINPAVDLDALYDAIINVNGDNEGSALYETDEFVMYASCFGNYFSASFKPTNDTSSVVEKSPIQKAQDEIIEIGEQFLDYELTADDAIEKLKSVSVPECEGKMLLEMDTRVLIGMIYSTKSGAVSRAGVEYPLNTIKEYNYDDITANN